MRTGEIGSYLGWVIHEFGLILLLFGLVLGFLFIGSQAAQIATLVQRLSGRQISGVAVARIPDSVPYWELETTDLTYGRVWHNLSTKRGMGLLWGYLVLTLVGVAVVLHGGRWAVRIRVRTSDERLEPGTIRIRASNGVIYVSGVSPIIEGMREYATRLGLGVMMVESTN